METAGEPAGNAVLEYLGTHWYRWLILAVVVAFLVYTFKFLRKRFPVVREFFVFLKERKLWWMTPMAVVFVLLACVVVATDAAWLMPFIYIVF